VHGSGPAGERRSFSFFCRPIGLWKIDNPSTDESLGWTHITPVDTLADCRTALLNEVEPRDRDVADGVSGLCPLPHKHEQMRKISFRGLKKMRAGKRLNIAPASKHWPKCFKSNQLPERQARQLSGGRADVVCMGRAIIREPSVSCLTSPYQTLMPS